MSLRIHAVTQVVCAGVAPRESCHPLPRSWRPGAPHTPRAAAPALHAARGPGPAMARVPVLCLFGRRVVWEVSLLPSQSPGFASWVKM